MDGLSHLQGKWPLHFCQHWTASSIFTPTIAPSRQPLCSSIHFIYIRYDTCRLETPSHHSEHYRQGHLCLLEKTKFLILTLEAPRQILMSIVNFCHPILQAAFDLLSNSESARGGLNRCPHIAILIVNPQTRLYQMPCTEKERQL